MSDTRFLSDGARDSRLRSQSQLQISEVSASRYRSISAEFDVFRVKRRRRRALSSSHRGKSVSTASGQAPSSLSPSSKGLFLLSTRVPDLHSGQAIYEPSSYSSATFYSGTNDANNGEGMLPSSLEEGISLSEFLNGRYGMCRSGNPTLVKIRHNVRSSDAEPNTDILELNSTEREYFESDQNTEFHSTTVTSPLSIRHPMNNNTVYDIHKVDYSDYSSGSNKNYSNTNSLDRRKIEMSDLDNLLPTPFKQFRGDGTELVKDVPYNFYRKDQDTKSINGIGNSNIICTPYRGRADNSVDLTANRQNRISFCPSDERASSNHFKKSPQNSMYNTPISADSKSDSRMFQKVPMIQMDRELIISPILVPPRHILLPYQGL